MDIECQKVDEERQRDDGLTTSQEVKQYGFLRRQRERGGGGGGEGEKERERERRERE